MSDISSGTKERFAIYVTGTPYCTEGKLINIFTIPDGIGETLAKDLIRELENHLGNTA